MYGFKILLAAALLTQPEAALDTTDHELAHTLLSPTMQQLAIRWEILDARETSHILADSRDFAGDLEMLQKRYRDLGDAPPLAEYQRFPDRDAVNSMLSFNRQFRQDLSNRLSFDVVHAEEVRAAIMETEHLYRIWDTVRDIRCGYYYITVRRRALKELRDLLGETAFYRGELPPPVPVYRLPWRE